MNWSYLKNIMEMNKLYEQKLPATKGQILLEKFFGFTPTQKAKFGEASIGRKILHVGIVRKSIGTVPKRKNKTISVK